MPFPKSWTNAEKRTSSLFVKIADLSIDISAKILYNNCVNLYIKYYNEIYIFKKNILKLNSYI